MKALNAIVLGACIAPCLALSADSAKPDPWAPVRLLIGQWEGTTQGEPGHGTVSRTYQFVLGDRFIHERNTSVYPPQEKNEKGEVHEHWSFISHDRKRKALVLRQFHKEGFVNQYVYLSGADSGGPIVFESEAFENLDSRWRARETYEIVGTEEFIETFELAEPGKPFQTYSQNRFKRVRN